jgi:uncharacterized repeat protein (TIGR03943 family)
MRLDWVKLVRGGGLLAWAAFFDWLWLSGRAGDYVGPRTAWVVPFGGIVLTVAAVLYLRGAVRRGGAPVRPASAGELLGLVALLAPLLLVAAAPSSSLGALAVDRKRSTGDQVAAVNRLKTTADLSLYDIAGANASTEYARDHDIRAGIRVDIDGLVSGELEEGTFEFSRFLASCCAADAMPFSIRVQPPADAPELELSQWLQVAGTLQSIGGSLVVLAERMEPIDRPANPYGL